MNREALDEFFAKAEDVLADWGPSADAMVARVEDEGADLRLADSYYEQTPYGGYSQRWALGADWIWRACNQIDDDETPRDRALRLRRERNGGPADRRGLDGRTRRRSA